MKKSLLLGLTLTLCAGAFAQVADEDEYIVPTLLEDTYLQRMSPNGTYAVGQDPYTSVVVHNTKTGVTEFYPAAYPGMGNCVANNGIVVGQQMQTDGSYAAIMFNGRFIVSAAMRATKYSEFEAVTPDGTRATGYMANPTNVGPVFIPFYCDINASGGASNPIPLPCPEKDLFGVRAMYVIGAVISDDGKTIGGIVYDSTTSYTWPIIWREDEDGVWTYNQPVEKNFNPNNLPLPKDPDDFQFDLREPQPEDFMTPEQIEQYHKALVEYAGLYDWYDLYWRYSDNDGNDYVKAHEAWANLYAEEYLKALREFERTQLLLGGDLHYGGIIFINHEGTEFITGKYGTPYTFDLSDIADIPYQPLGLQMPRITLTQWLPDGTFLGCATQGESPTYAYIKLAGSDEFIKVTDYLAQTHPSYLYWLEDSFFNTTDGLMTGLITVSDDLSIIAGGYVDPEGGMYSYLYGGVATNEVENVSAVQNDTFEVYNLNGVKVLSTKDKGALKNLPKGIYIVNGEKVVI